MALQKQPVTINFQKGIDTKSDPFQLPLGNFELLVNSVFGVTGRLTKRNGFQSFASLPDGSYSYATTFSGNLLAVGKNLAAYSAATNSWLDRGGLQPVRLGVTPLVRNNYTQAQIDGVLSPNGLMCSVYTETTSSGGAFSFSYAISDATTGQSVVKPTTIQANFGTANYAPKVFCVGNNFVIVFPSSDGSSTHLQYFSVNCYSPTSVSSVSDIATNFTLSSVSGGFDGVVANSNLYLAWNGSSRSGLKAAYLNQTLSLSGAVTLASSEASIVSMCADTTQASPVIWASAYVIGSNSGVTVATDQSLGTYFSARQFISSSTAQITNMASTAQSGSMSLFYEVKNFYTFGSAQATNYINKLHVTQTGSVSGAFTIVQSVGLASKAFLLNSTSYFLSTYQSPYQSTYFLMNGTADNFASGGAKIVSRLAYGNGGGYLPFGLPSVTISSQSAYIPYLVKTLVQPVNKVTNASSTTQTAGIYTQLGANVVKFTFDTSKVVSSETANNLHLNGGFLWMYDGLRPVEQNFFLYPDNVTCSVSLNGGTVAAQVYFYQATYEWSDNQGNIFRSAPSQPTQVTVTGSNSSVSVNVPVLRLTYKGLSPTKICVYRWSQAQQTYYLVNSAAPPPSVVPGDSIAIVDSFPDERILGNVILYTNGGVLENSGASGLNAITLFDNRLFGIEAEDPNLLQFSKTIVPSTPVELSDFLTLFVPPTTSTNIETGPMTCLAPMDDKLIIFKKNALYYINGSGPDNTGANSQYSQPTFITATVGCENQRSIVFTPNGLMFQSDNGIWLLSRDLSTSYIGAPAEGFNGSVVVAAVRVPSTTQVRFTLDTGEMLMYDFYYNQWGEFSGLPGVSGTVYNNLHTFINRNGQLYQENPGSYLDGSSPVLMSFRTGWLNFAGLQGYQRSYEMYLLGQYYTPHRLTMGIAYDYDPAVSQLVSIVPDNYSGPWGSGTSWGSISVWGGSSRREQWQVNFQRQQAQSIQLSFNEYYDGSFGVTAGAGLTVSGLTVLTGIKKGSPGNIPAIHRKG